MKSVIVFIVSTVLISFKVHANDVQPRLYSNVPVGVSFISVGYAYSDGEVTFDSSIPVEDVEGVIDSVLLSYSRGLNIAGKSALFTFAVPYADVGLEGLYLGEPASGQRQGIGDARVRLAVNFYGAPATTLKEYASYQQKTIVGGSISIGIPFGRYSDDRLLNVGSNRWNVIGQLGVSHRVKRWTLESAVGVSLNSDNDDVLGDRTLKQNPIGLFRGTALYNFSPRFWVGAGFIYSYGGDTELDGVKRDDKQKNWRTGVAMSVPLARRHTLQLRITEGVTARIGSDFRTYGISYSYSF